MCQLHSPERCHGGWIRALRDGNTESQAVVLLQYAERKGFKLRRLVGGDAPVAAHLQVPVPLLLNWRKTDFQ